MKFFGVFKCCEEITKKEFYSQAVSSSMKLQTQFFYLWYYVSLPKMPHPFFTNLQRAESIVVVEELQVFSFMEHLPYEELLQCCCQSCILLFLSTSSSLLPVSSATTTLLFSTLELVLTFHSQIFYPNHHSKSGSFCFNLYDRLNYRRGIAALQQWVTDQKGTIALRQWVPNQLVSTLFQASLG